MATIVTRAGKGSPLTNAEVDQNFLNLNSAKLEAGDLSSYLLSATAASTYQTILGFTPYNATNPSNYITSAALTTYAPLASPTFTGTVSADSFSGSGASLTGLTSGQITTALGFTPYNSTNPSNYVTSSALATYAPLASPTFTGTASFGIAKPTALQETRVAMAANNIDLSTGNIFTKTISGATTLTVSNVPASGTVASFILDLTNAGTLVTWWYGVKWASAIAPTLTTGTGGRDILGFMTYDNGATWTGLVLAKDVR